MAWYVWLVIIIILGFPALIIAYLVIAVQIAKYQGLKEGEKMVEEIYQDISEWKIKQ